MDNAVRIVVAAGSAIAGGSGVATMGGLTLLGGCGAAYLLWGSYKRPLEPRQMPRNVDGRTAEELRREALEKFGINTVDHYNIAFCGMTGVGKSSLINALRGIDDDHILAARVEAGREGTTHLMKYPHPDRNVSEIYFWDIPGAGTLVHPTENYFVDKCLYAFDFLFIVSASRFNEVEFKMMTEATKYNVPVVFVRNKIDQDVDNEMRKRKINRNDKNGIDQIKNDLKANVWQSLEDNSQVANIRETGRLFITSTHSMINKDDAKLYGMDEVDLVTHMWNVIKINRCRP